MEDQQSTSEVIKTLSDTIDRLEAEDARVAKMPDDFYLGVLAERMRYTLEKNPNHIETLALQELFSPFILPIRETREYKKGVAYERGKRAITQLHKLDLEKHTGKRRIDI